MRFRCIQSHAWPRWDWRELGTGVGRMSAMDIRRHTVITMFITAVGLSWVLAGCEIVPSAPSVPTADPAPLVVVAQGENVTLHVGQHITAVIPNGDGAHVDSPATVVLTLESKDGMTCTTGSLPACTGVASRWDVAGISPGQVGISDSIGTCPAQTGPPPFFVCDPVPPALFLTVTVVP